MESFIKIDPSVWAVEMTHTHTHTHRQTHTQTHRHPRFDPNIFSQNLTEYKKERNNKKETLYIPQSITRSGRIAKQPIKLDL